MANIKKLSLIFNKRYSDFIVTYPIKYGGKLALRWLLQDQLKWRPTMGNDKIQYEVFNFINELEKMGFDKTTLRFSIELKKQTEGDG